MLGIAWASCWPSAVQSARDNNPIPILLGAFFIMLPDTLDHWVSQYLRKPGIHIVPPPEAPEPHMIAAALAHAVSQSHHTGRHLRFVCYPIPVGTDQWTPYTIHFDSANQSISVLIAGSIPDNATEPVSTGFIPDHTTKIFIHAYPVVFQTEPITNGRVSIKIMPWQQQWTHSLITALAISALTTTVLGWTAGIIAGGAYTWHIFTDQWGFTGSALFWPFNQKRYSGLQWIKPHQSQTVNCSMLWLAILLISGNIMDATSPAIEGLSLLQLLLFGGAIPLVILRRFRLHRVNL
ncbi:MAG: hypothetical protein WCI03_02240 [bacterium]|jgi:hypothetical protein